MIDRGPPRDPGFWEESEPRDIAGLDRCTKAGWLGMILAWWHDDPELVLDAGHAVALVPYVIAGETAAFTEHDWWLLADALGSFEHRDEFLEAVYGIAASGAEGELPPGNTTCFDDDLRVLLREERRRPQ